MVTTHGFFLLAGSFFAYLAAIWAFQGYKDMPDSSKRVIHWIAVFAVAVIGVATFAVSSKPFDTLALIFLGIPLGVSALGSLVFLALVMIWIFLDRLFNSTFLVRFLGEAHPHFETNKEQAINQLRTALIESGTLTPELEAILQSPTKLRDLIAIPRESWEIIGAYSKVLSEDAPPLRPLSKLPYPKDIIKKAIEAALVRARDPEQRGHLENILYALDDFVPDENVPKDPEDNVKAWLLHREALAQEMRKKRESDAA